MPAPVAKYNLPGMLENGSVHWEYFAPYPDDFHEAEYVIDAVNHDTEPSEPGSNIISHFYSNTSNGHAIAIPHEYADPYTSVVNRCFPIGPWHEAQGVVALAVSKSLFERFQDYDDYSHETMIAFDVDEHYYPVYYVIKEGQGYRALCPLCSQLANSCMCGVYVDTTIHVNYPLCDPSVHISTDIPDIDGINFVSEYVFLVIDKKNGTSNVSNLRQKTPEFRKEGSEIIEPRKEVNIQKIQEISQSSHTCEFIHSAGQHLCGNNTSASFDERNGGIVLLCGVGPGLNTAKCPNATGLFSYAKETSNASPKSKCAKKQQVKQYKCERKSRKAEYESAVSQAKWRFKLYEQTQKYKAAYATNISTVCSIPIPATVETITAKKGEKKQTQKQQGPQTKGKCTDNDNSTVKHSNDTSSRQCWEHTNILERIKGSRAGTSTTERFETNSATTTSCGGKIGEEQSGSDAKASRTIGEWNNGSSSIRVNQSKCFNSSFSRSGCANANGTTRSRNCKQTETRTRGTRTCSSNIYDPTTSTINSNVHCFKSVSSIAQLIDSGG